MKPKKVKLTKELLFQIEKFIATYDKSMYVGEWPNIFSFGNSGLFIKVWREAHFNGVRVYNGLKEIEINESFLLKKKASTLFGIVWSFYKNDKRDISSYITADTKAFEFLMKHRSKDAVRYYALAIKSVSKASAPEFERRIDMFYKHTGYTIDYSFVEKELKYAE